MPPKKKLRTEPIVRVRTGCFTCRRRKKKCDESRPACGGCVRNKLICNWPSPRRENPDEDDAGEDLLPHLSPSANRDASVSSSPPDSSSAGLTTSPGDAVVEEEILAPLVPVGCTHPSPSSDSMEPTGSCWPTSVSTILPRSLSMLPGYSPDSFELLSHYLATTADCMANGSTPVNPFLVQIVPLAFTSDLLLQLVLTQSAAHRAFRRQRDHHQQHQPDDAVAQGHYTRALRLFRRGVTDFLDGKETNPLMLTVGALVMCFTETAKGDITGTIFDHLSAANSLLSRLLSLSDAAVPAELKAFVIEYYTYTAATSMISIDARLSAQLLLDFDLEQRARQLSDRQYVGNLCGCWMELLLLIPCIFDLGRQWMRNDAESNNNNTNSNNNNRPPSADDIAMYGSLQAQLTRWTPYPSVSHEVMLAGRIFQQAMLLYLYTALTPFSRRDDSSPTSTGLVGMHRAQIDAAVLDALAYLAQLDATARINSGLCWPIVVVGSCLADTAHQDSLRRRLVAMVERFGLGNMQRTLLLLEHMWRVPPDQAGPWNICRAMERTQIWISFA
ncbi:Zn(II)2Cys6 transcription factor [Aspergillus candidus]|uniref:Fungal-specific transcription factor domain-domain-containing protein n=1 Tax=Aspergillus candidus TaxID=41067 RepID=A0A2I2FIM4_ASPCN|nr:fungal-specific transcription factor domain-domain-containing protein [Aspergillus candidus]PLB40481.1 fungal-specific transcription factor domain-domain-containing protein [Aspergillus candidus]